MADGQLASGDVSSFEKALNIWEEVSLRNLQKNLDDEALEIKENQKSLLISRKELAGKTKAFKKLEDNEKLSEIKPLLKAYQNEIDNLTKKNKFVEAAFFKFYKDISEAPDPAPLLSNSLKSFKVSSDIDSLKQENSQLQEKLSKYKDYESIKAKFMESEQKHAENLKVKLLLKGDEYKSQLHEKEHEFKVSEMNYERKIATLLKQVSELKAFNKIAKNKLKSQRQILSDDNDDEDDDENVGNEDLDDDSTKLSEMTDDDNKNKSALKIELDLVTKDLQYTKSKVVELSKRNQELKNTLDEFQSSKDTDEEAAKLKEKLEILEKNNSVLIQKSNTDQRTISKLQEEILQKSKELESNKLDYSSKITHLKNKLTEHLDYDEIKNELNILRSIEFDVDLENENGDTAKDIDHNLMLRNRKLNNDLVEYRNKNSQLQQEVTKLSYDLQNAEANIAKLKHMNEKLEADILNVKSSTGHNTDNWEAMSMLSGVSRYPRTITPGSNRGEKLSPAASIAGFDENASVVGSTLGGRGGVSGGPDSSLLPIITQQRDRFRAKNTELESKIREGTKLISDLRKHNTNLERKVTNLSTEMKFLQSKSARGAKSQAPLASSNPYGNQFASSTYDVLLDDYESFSYISNSRTLHFLDKYLGADTTKRVDRKLNQIEKCFYGFLKIVLKNQTTRTIFIAYWFALHFAFILGLFRFGLSSFWTTSTASVGSAVTTTNKVILPNDDAAKLIADAAGISKPEAVAAVAAVADKIKVVPQAAADAIKVD